MNATEVSPTGLNYPVALANYNLQPRHAAVYDIPERPKAPVPEPPLLRYEECPTIKVSDADEEYCLTAYGDISVSDHYDVVDVAEDEQKLRVPRLKHTRPRARSQAQVTKPGWNPVSVFDSDNLGEPPLIGNTGQLEHEYFRNVIKTTSPDPPVTPEVDFREFFENLLKKPPPTSRRQRTQVLSDSVASEAIDARPRSN